MSPPRGATSAAGPAEADGEAVSAADRRLSGHTVLGSLLDGADDDGRARFFFRHLGACRRRTPRTRAEGGVYLKMRLSEVSPTPPSDPI